MQRWSSRGGPSWSFLWAIWRVAPGLYASSLAKLTEMFLKLWFSWGYAAGRPAVIRLIHDDVFFFLTHVWYFLTSWVDLLAWTVLQGQLGTISWIPETWLRSMWATQRKETKKYKTYGLMKHDQTTHQVKGRDTSSIHEVGSSWVRTCMVLAPWGMAFTRPSSGPNLRSAAAGRRIWMDAGWSDP